MIFNEIYSAYYNAVAAIIKKAIINPVGRSELHQIVQENAFGESVPSIEQSIYGEKWQLIKKDGTTPIENIPDMPLTLIQKRWLKAVSLDKRMKLFVDEPLDFGDVEPLFTSDDIEIFDKYSDGDNYTDEQYIHNFRLILDAIRNKYPLNIRTRTRSGAEINLVILPKYLEYSEKDDKFRLIGSGSSSAATINLSRIVSCMPCSSIDRKSFSNRVSARQRQVVFQLSDERNALDRVLMSFAHFRKEAEQLDDRHYQVTVFYDKDDETELLIRILSFGPMIKVIAPVYFKNLIKERLKRQKNCGL
ncbi:MAG: WYL domain-containing protein [Eubacteriaceae bacterium]|nr:WYL domain-containing protein [Eubacteriaceae bacterium]